MKKVLFTLVIMVALLYIAPVFALDVSVCDSGCTYTSVNQVLGAMDSGTINEEVMITVDTLNEQKVGSHTLTHPVGISFTKNAAIFNGEGSTLTIPKGADIWFEGNSIEIKNLKINYTGSFGDFSNGFIDDVVYLDASSATLNDITITGTGATDCFLNPAAIFNESDNTEMNNVKIEKFSTAINHGAGNLIINSSTINNNVISVLSEGNVSVENSSIKNLVSYKAVSTKNVGDLKNTIYDIDEIDTMEAEEQCPLFSKKGIHLFNDPNMSISMERTMDINMRQASSIDNVVSIFKEGTFNLNDYTVTSSDENIASVKNNVITFKKGGQVTITAANPDTKESYVLNLRISNPISNNPITSPNTFFTIGIILIMLGGITMYRTMRSEQ